MNDECGMTNDEGRTLAALRDSIAHWNRMRFYKSEDRHEHALETPSARNCALCSVFLDFSTGWESCHGCPVYERTGRHVCRGTPWQAANHAFYGDDDAAWQSACDEMIAFLESLLPKGGAA